VRLSRRPRRPTSSRPPSTLKSLRSPSRRTSSCKSVPPARGLRGSSSRSVLLERERTAREAAQKSLEERNVEFSKLEGELVVLSITNASQEQSLKEQSDTVISLQQAVEAERRALEVERKQVEGRSLFCLLFC
jgi:hypothetical protein